jgi:hypothetical protein
MMQMEEGVEALVYHQDDTAAAATVAAVGTAFRHELLPPERNAAVAPIAGPYGDANRVDQHGRRQPIRDAFASGRTSSNVMKVARGQLATMLMYRP